ncbi:MAG: CmcJ/NvfI family oxidoreductase, partial [Halieaceae bacterium]|nr:CmcJ/NvfI family oxidoreductase [Halieaceae bacterium]
MAGWRGQRHTGTGGACPQEIQQRHGDPALNARQLTTQLQYLVYTGERPIYHASVGGADAALSISARFDTHEVAVHNARDMAPPATLDREGFALVPHPTGVEDFYAPMEFWQQRYEAEISELLLAASGASEIFIFDHTLRSDSQSVRGEHAIREPATVIHNDYTDASAEKRLYDLLDDRAQEWLAGR